jgi:hypothetical protein
VQQLLRKTSETHPDYHNIETAISEIRKVLDYLNDDLKQEEAKRKVSEIAAAFDTSLDTLVCVVLSLIPSFKTRSKMKQYQQQPIVFFSD